jgi:hypothetical protein
MQNLWIAFRRLLRTRSLPKAPDDRRWIVFDDGRVAFLAPKDYAIHREQDETVAVYPPGKDSGITIRLSLQTKPLQPEMCDDVAEEFVSDAASKRGMKLTRLKDRIFVTESREADWPDRRVLMHYWQVGCGRILVVMSATIWGADRQAAAVQRALAEIPRMIESLRLT